MIIAPKIRVENMTHPLENYLVLSIVIYRCIYPGLRSITGRAVTANENGQISHGNNDHSVTGP
jgi:hypothetical protein